MPAAAQLNYYSDQELPNAVFDWSAAGEDFSTGWTFTVRLCHANAKATTLLLKTTGITSTATTVTVAWSLTDWAGLENSISGTPYVLYLYARRTSDSKDLEFNPGKPTTLNLYTAAGTSATSPSSYPITVTAASVTLVDAGGYLAATDVEAGFAETGYNRRHRPMAQYGLKQRLTNAGLGGPIVVTLAGDSTGNDPTDWFYPFITQVGALYPAWTVQHRLWSDTNQSYDRPTYVQTGTAGLSYFVPANASSCSTADSATVSVTNSDLRIQARIRKTALVTGANAVIASQYGNAGNRGWRFYFDTTGRLIFEYSTDGTTLSTNVIASSAQVSAAITAASDAFIGLVFTRNNGTNSTIQAITSADGITWSNFGTLVTGATVTTIFDTTQSAEVGTRTAGIEALDGRVYWVEAYKGTTSTSPLAWRFDASLYDNSTTFIDAEGKTWSLSGAATITKGAPALLAMNGSVAGQNLAYLDNVTRRPLMLSAPTDILIVNTGHNEGVTDFGSSMSTYITNATAIWPSMAVVAVKQNPQASNATNYRRHAQSMAKLGAQASRFGWGVVDAFQAFQDTGTPNTYTVDADVHPNALGFALWTAEAMRSFGFV